MFAGILADYCWTNKAAGNSPADFKIQAPVLEALGISSYDSKQKLEHLIFTIREAIEDQKKTWRMNDIPAIEKIIKYCIVREMFSIDERKGARYYEKNRPRSVSSDSLDGPRVDDVDKKSSLYNGSHSPSKSPSPQKKGMSPSPQHRRMGSSNMMRSIGNSSEANYP